VQLGLARGVEVVLLTDLALQLVGPALERLQLVEHPLLPVLDLLPLLEGRLLLSRQLLGLGRWERLHVVGQGLVRLSGFGTKFVRVGAGPDGRVGGVQAGVRVAGQVAVAGLLLGQGHLVRTVAFGHLGLFRRLVGVPVYHFAFWLEAVLPFEKETL